MPLEPRLTAVSDDLDADDRAFRLALWRDYGALPEQADELLAYAESPLRTALPAPRVYPLPDAPCVADWERYAAEARRDGAAVVLRRVLMQVRFPIAAGISRTAAYLEATRYGDGPDERLPGLIFEDPEGLEIFLHRTPAGRVPVVLARARRDFESLQQAIMRRNEPEPVPASMGACLIAGYNNWERVAALRRAFEASQPADPDGTAWDAAFEALLPQHERYQDRFMLLSSGPYSATPAAAMALDDAAWCTASIALRLAHECSHYFTRQALGFMRKSLLDELVSDYVALVEAFGHFRSAHLLHFLGLEAHPRYRDGGRLQNYRGTPPLSDGAFAVLQHVAVRAAATLERIQPLRRAGSGIEAMRDKACVTIALMRVGLEGLAAPDADARLAHALDESRAVTLADDKAVSS